MSRISVYIWAIFATEIDSIPYGIFFTIISIFKICTSQNSSVKKDFSSGDFFFFLEFNNCTDRHKKKFTDKVRQ